MDGSTHVLALRGELDVATVPRLADPLRVAIAAGKTSVVIDLGELTFLDSTGLMVLLNGLRRVVRQGGNLVISCTNPTVLRLFDITGTAAEQVVEKVGLGAAILVGVLVIAALIYFHVRRGRHRPTPPPSDPEPERLGTGTSD